MFLLNFVMQEFSFHIAELPFQNLPHFWNPIFSPKTWYIYLLSGVQRDWKSRDHSQFFCGFLGQAKSRHYWGIFTVSCAPKKTTFDNKFEESMNWSPMLIWRCQFLRWWQGFFKFWKPVREKEAEIPTIGIQIFAKNSTINVHF